MERFTHSLAILNNELTLSNQARFLKKHGMYSAALFYKNMNDPVERRAARVTRYALENQALPVYRKGQHLLFSAPDDVIQKVPGDDCNGYGLWVWTNGDIRFDSEKFQCLKAQCSNCVEETIVELIEKDCRAVGALVSRSRYDHGGVHNVPDMEYVIHNGIRKYRHLAEEKRDSSTDPKVRAFEEGMLDVIAGIEAFMQRYTVDLEAIVPEDEKEAESLQKLITAAKKVPMEPAESFYEAFVSAQAVMFFAGAFEPGRMDAYLWPYYKKDLEEGKICREEAYDLIRELFQDIDDRNGHPGVTHVTVGGTAADGSAVYNELTEMVIKAIGGHRAPNVTLRVRKDMPQNLWDAFLYNIGKGYAQPAIVNEDLYLEQLVKEYAIPYEDAVNFAFGGCAEVLIQGKSMCDSTWVAYNMLDIFEQTMYNHFLECDTFEAFYKKLKEEYTITLREVEEQINLRQFAYGVHHPWTLATLLTGDCIANARSYTAGGARYNFDSANIYGGTNVINSLYTLKYFYEGKLGELDKESFLQTMISNFEGYRELYAMCRKVPKFGNGDQGICELASDLMNHVFEGVMQLRCYRSNPGYTGRFMPAIILWVDWIECGRRLGATPDGRAAGQATVDSCGPMQGTDKEGPTAVMEAALSLPQQKCVGTCVLNLRLDSAMFQSEEGLRKVQQLCQTYFMQGGCQLQINVLDPEDLLAALQDPDNYENLIVRVGGFSDNFVKLSPEIQQEVIKRTKYSI